MRLSSLRALSLLLVITGCDCGGDDDPGTDGSLPDDGSFDGAPVDAPDTDAPLPMCVGMGGACDDAADCCEGPCEGGTCTMGSCRANGVACDGAGDCCSTRCEAGVCAAPPSSCGSVGAGCADASDCCSNHCVDSGGADCVGTSGCVCAPPTACRAGGQACTADAQCCNGLCDRPDGGEGRCATLSACGTAGEPCSSEGLSGSCCSTVCLDTGEGPRCQYLGGCRVQDELCRTDGECCSGACQRVGMTLDGREIKRCANADSCLPPGEVCGEGGSSSNCCPNGGGDTGCEPTGTGFRRCFGGSRECTLPGRACETTADCCLDAFPAIMCQPDRTGTRSCCLADGEECAFGDVCCGGICAPDPTDGVLRCGATCIADGAACTTAADCCGCGCVPDGAGGNVCTSDAALCDACTGPQLGELCTLGGEACCNGPTVICDPTAGVEFPTCVLNRAL
ncbi:MAG: hypothetical protein H6724_18850 [Sandaracinus sp.]|nr:hypothetical protein [Sandaracinus sp.]